MMKSDFPQVTRITEARACDNAHLSIRLGVWTDDGQGFVRAPRIAARQLCKETQSHLARAQV